MQNIDIQCLLEIPSDPMLYPDFIVSSMLFAGPCRVEADYAALKDNMVDFVLTERATGTQQTVLQVPSRFYRSILARFAVFSSLENLYCGHTLFSCDFARDGQLRPHRFSLFLCNEPTMGYWLKLYLYGIDQQFPFPYDKKPDGNR